MVTRWGPILTTGGAPMPIEKLQTKLVSKPWGVRDLSPWCSAATKGQLIGEVLYERSDSNGPPSQLRLKVLFADQPLSIQVHPNDETAQESGFSFGKTESYSRCNWNASSSR